MLLPDNDVKADVDRASELAAKQLRGIHEGTDRLFAYLMVAQWIAGIVAAIWISPRTWAGDASQTHIHVWLAIGLGGAITGLPAIMAWLRPGRLLTRHTIAIGQMLSSALLIHLTGGRIETHFHIFGSLAFLACYRDMRVLLTATIVIAADHAVRGFFWPESIYGVLNTGWLRFFEHAGWVVFETVFLCTTINQSLKAMQRVAIQQAQLEWTNQHIEEQVRSRTNELTLAIEETANVNHKLAGTIDALEEKNKELDQFTYIASHDLQEPVRKLVSFSSLLEQDIDGELNENAKRDLEFITDAAKRMKSLVQSLLELSRVGRSAMNEKPIELSACVDDALHSLSLRIEETDAEIICDEMPTIVGDRTMLTQLYQNLIGNALKFVEDKPIIRLTAIADGANWKLGVKDNGIGMKPEYAERIFQPFQRLHNRGEYEGTGIGLSICSKTVQRHGGRIWVESSVGHGAHFLFLIPTTRIVSKQSQRDADDVAICVPTKIPLPASDQMNVPSSI